MEEEEAITQKEFKRRVRKILKELLIEDCRTDEMIETKLSEYFGTSRLRDGARKTLKFELEKEEFCPKYETILRSIEKIVKFEFDDGGAEYIFHLKGGKKISVEDEDMLKKNVFDTLYLNETTKAAMGSFDEYRYFIARCLSGKDVVVETSEKEMLGEHTEAKEAIMQFIEGGVVVENIDDMRFDYSKMYITNEEHLYVSGRILRKILERENIRLSMRKLRLVLNKYLVGATKVIRVKDKTTRVWVFDVNKLPVKVQFVRVGDDYADEKN